MNLFEERENDGDKILFTYLLLYIFLKSSLMQFYHVLVNC